MTRIPRSLPMRPEYGNDFPSPALVLARMVWLEVWDLLEHTDRNRREYPRIGRLVATLAEAALALGRVDLHTELSAYVGALRAHFDRAARPTLDDGAADWKLTLKQRDRLHARVDPWLKDCLAWHSASPPTIKAVVVRTPTWAGSAMSAARRISLAEPPAPDAGEKEMEESFDLNGFAGWSDEPATPDAEAVAQREAFEAGRDRRLAEEARRCGRSDIADALEARAERRDVDEWQKIQMEDEIEVWLATEDRRAAAAATAAGSEQARMQRYRGGRAGGR